MNLEVWHIWIIVAIVFFIIEIFTSGFLTASLAIGCLFAALISYLNYGVNPQIISFSAGTLVSFFAIRPFMLKYAHKKSNHIKTNADALIDKTGRVTQTINNSLNQGRVYANGDDWKAESENNEIINQGEKVKIIEVKSTILIVKPLN